MTLTLVRVRVRVRAKVTALQMLVAGFVTVVMAVTSLAVHVACKVRYTSRLPVNGNRYREGRTKLGTN